MLSASARVQSSERRYKLRYIADAVPRYLVVVDNWTGAVLIRCQGETAAYLVASLGYGYNAENLSVRIDKATVKALSLRMTATQLRRSPRADVLPHAADRLLLRLMRDCSGVHFTPDSTALLMDFHGIAYAPGDADAALVRLHKAGCLSFIAVANQRGFYDTNTAAHWHLYDTEADELHDLELTGNARLDRELATALSVASRYRVIGGPDVSPYAGADTGTTRLATTRALD